MNRLRITILSLSVLMACNAAGAEDFSIKGITVGASEKVCGPAKLSRHQADLEATGVKGFDFPATGCNINFDTIAGLKPSGPAHLLFWKGRLIRIVVKFERLDLQDAAALRTAFRTLHGNPESKWSSPFRTDTWRSGANTMQLEWEDGSRYSSAGAFLTDTKNWSEYEESRAKANKLVEALDKKHRVNDLR